MGDLVGIEFVSPIDAVVANELLVGALGEMFFGVAGAVNVGAIGVFTDFAVINVGVVVNVSASEVAVLRGEGGREYVSEHFRSTGHLT